MFCPFTIIDDHKRTSANGAIVLTVFMGNLKGRKFEDFFIFHFISLNVNKNDNNVYHSLL